MTTVEERIAVVETKVDGLLGDVGEVKTDVTTIKADVKSLLLSRAATTGVWTVVVKSIPFIALLVAIAATVRG